jgi:hypothetical protein
MPIKNQEVQARADRDDAARSSRRLVDLTVSTMMTDSESSDSIRLIWLWQSIRDRHSPPAPDRWATREEKGITFLMSRWFSSNIRPIVGAEFS